jgi:hypothetical protein
MSLVESGPFEGLNMAGTGQLAGGFPRAIRMRSVFNMEIY